MKTFIVGSLNMDLVIKAPYAPAKGETIEGEGFMTNGGGKGANQAVAVAKLGGQAHMVGCVGDAFGSELVGTLSGYGVDTGYVQHAEGVSSGIAVIVVTDGDNRIILDKGANGRVTKELIDGALEGAGKGDYLVLQLEIGLDMVEHALALGKKKGMVTVLNPAPARELSAEIFAACDYFIPNQTECKLFTGIYPEDGAGVLECARILQGKGVDCVVVTMGERGSVCVTKEAVYEVCAFPAKAIDTTAAGDTYVGALVVRLSEGASLPEAMRFASAASAIGVTRRGAQQSIPTRAEVDEFLAKHA